METLEPLITACKTEWKVYLRNLSEERGKTENSAPNEGCEVKALRLVSGRLYKNTKALQQSSVTKYLRLALKFHAKQWFNVHNEKRIVNDDAFRNFYWE